MTYLCYDSALNEEYTLIKLMERYPSYISLFNGTDDAAIWDAAPYLFLADEDFCSMREDRLIQLDNWILFHTKETLSEASSFLQYYIYRNIDGKLNYHRIWDAKVLKNDIGGWHLKELEKFFSVFDAIFFENEKSKYLDKWHLDDFNKPTVTIVNKGSVLKPLSIMTESDEIAVNPDSTKEIIEQKQEEIKVLSNIAAAPKRRKFFID